MYLERQDKLIGYSFILCSDNGAIIMMSNRYASARTRNKRLMVIAQESMIPIKEGKNNMIVYGMGK